MRFYLRQINKPIVEKKRRERINGCLEELKIILLHATNKREVQFFTVVLYCIVVNNTLISQRKEIVLKRMLLIYCMILGRAL